MKKVLVALVIAVMLVSVVLCRVKTVAERAGDAEALADVKKAIDKANAQWSEGWAKGDAASIASLFAENGVQLTGSGKIFKGPKEIGERLKTAMQGADPGVKVTVTTVNVWLDGDVAYETGKYKYEYTEKGKPGVDEGRYVTMWKRQSDGSWKLTMDMGVPQN
ncbi:MAG TPA: nuclear transport factor 2 family protein [Pyrinomonadaceae bacterium]|nr:nuclear transport factor 2 family protein [Pyrinomonadaceae bacterium]